MKKINYIQDESFLHNLLKQTEVKFEKIRIFSGYMNIIPNLISTISQNIPNIEIYTSSPKANSFYKGGKFKSYIPYMYRVYEHNILQHKPKHSNIKIYEYIKGNRKRLIKLNQIKSEDAKKIFDDFISREEKSIY